MSMKFNDPVSDETISKIKDKLGPVIDHDRKTFLFDKMAELRQSDMKEIANSANQVATVEINGEGDIKELADGTRYQVTDRGWVKLGDSSI